jgi:hypothetical protein
MHWCRESDIYRFGRTNGVRDPELPADPSLSLSFIVERKAKEAQVSERRNPQMTSQHLDRQQSGFCPEWESTYEQSYPIRFRL